MSSLVLIKHAMPDIRDDVPSQQWLLSEKGKKSSMELARHLKKYKTRRIYTSDEPKAAETGKIVANQLDLPHQSIKDVHENDRSGLKYLPREDYEKLFKKFFTNPSHRIIGKETAKEAATRFDAAVKEIVKKAEEDIILVTHGTVMSLFVNRYNDIDIFQLWNSLQCPSIIELSVPSFKITGIVEEIKSV
ncbi:MAG TPA: histidine phosphatase family protein [Bacillales bacterium]|nr:histidine phosphatase family protein [Bacillales bacterium]